MLWVVKREVAPYLDLIGIELGRHVCGEGALAGDSKAAENKRGQEEPNRVVSLKG